MRLLILFLMSQLNCSVLPISLEVHIKNNYNDLKRIEIVSGPGMTSLGSEFLYDFSDTYVIEENIELIFLDKFFIEN